MAQMICIITSYNMDTKYCRYRYSLDFLTYMSIAAAMCKRMQCEECELGR